jgi:hypothetical protein
MVHYELVAILTLEIHMMQYEKELDKPKKQNQKKVKSLNIMLNRKANHNPNWCYIAIQCHLGWDKKLCCCWSSHNARLMSAITRN